MLTLRQPHGGTTRFTSVGIPHATRTAISRMGLLSMLGKPVILRGGQYDLMPAVGILTGLEGDDASPLTSFSGIILVLWDEEFKCYRVCSLYGDEHAVEIPGE